MMPTSPLLALRKAIRARLNADSALTLKLGGQRVFDEAPRGQACPYVVFGDSELRDWSTTSDRGVDQRLRIEVWSEARGASEALDIAALIDAALRNAFLALDGHRLILLEPLTLDTRRTGQGRFAVATTRYRALTEEI